MHPAADRPRVATATVNTIRVAVAGLVLVALPWALVTATAWTV